MTGATDARDAVRQALAAAYRPVFMAGKSYAEAYAAAVAREDLVEALGHAVDVVAAAGHLAEVAAAAEKDARAVLARVMEETGATQIVSGNLMAYLTKKGSYVIVDDASLIPPEFMHQPPPQPDKGALKKALEAGQMVPGASVIRPNEQTLAIRSRSKAA